MTAEAPQSHIRRELVGGVVGALTAVVVALAATALARRLWPAYVAAEPTKSYAQGMLLARLNAGALCTVSGAFVATRVARDTGMVALWLGGLFLAVSLPIHLVRVWADYPPWYHVVYLSYLVPVAGLTGRLASRATRRRVTREFP